MLSIESVGSTLIGSHFNNSQYYVFIIPRLYAAALNFVIHFPFENSANRDASVTMLDTKIQDMHRIYVSQVMGPSGSYRSNQWGM